MSNPRLPTTTLASLSPPSKVKEEMEEEEKVEMDPSAANRMDKPNINHQNQQIKRSIEDQLQIKALIKIALVLSLFVLLMTYVVVPTFTFVHVSRGLKCSNRILHLTFSHMN